MGIPPQGTIDYEAVAAGEAIEQLISQREALAVRLTFHQSGIGGAQRPFLGGLI
ncbi:hypothetical protein SDC9_204761 [bioreactor metagenome]|uniref:Uncharacterized protein n=1 Tax=bioreactor metagenome TaxID=1076179 RepID=A0A645J0Y6_9ZZZZ